MAARPCTSWVAGRTCPLGYRLEDVAGDYGAVVREDLGGPIDVIGVSTGGSIAQVFAVRAERPTPEEAAGWWSRVVERDPSHARFRRATGRPFPTLRLVSVASDGAPEAPGEVSGSAR